MSALAQSPSTDAARPSCVGRVVIVSVFALATAGAFGLAWLTTDHTLSPKQKEARQRIRRLDGLLKEYDRNVGRFPSLAEGFTPLVQARTLQEVPVDPWGNPYVYRHAPKRGYALSLGADGKPGGTGEDADVTGGGTEEHKP